MHFLAYKDLLSLFQNEIASKLRHPEPELFEPRAWVLPYTPYPPEPETAIICFYFYRTVKF